jgi:hypothetical protein
MQWREIGLERGLVGEVGMIAEELQATGVVRGESISSFRRRNSRDSTFTGKRYLGRQPIQRVPSSDIPPPGTIMCTCG